MAGGLARRGGRRRRRESMWMRGWIEVRIQLFRPLIQVNDIRV